ncbi:hypothetical protein FCK90_13390 [Kocuria coralli]|uniref:Type I restriction modification DNA specificity domain-containing protein n=1 Tax=Kocuria coralli TaxID=1461025 RepID=A0A5J5KWA3_9MICC|nr:restriction endonuclease subunit S [Kocuria coralli]KAA9393175.1 hypothetical protein FCK90_13390 [Kocuria coralli]
MTWERDTLGSLGVEAQIGFASGKHSGVGELPHLRPMNITPHGALTLDGSKFVDAESGIQRVERGDVLFNNTNSPKWVGKTAWVNAAQELAYSNHMTRLRSPTHRLDSRFLASYLHFQQMSGYFEAICSNHVNQASVSRKRLLETEIPLPSLEEQRRIVAILQDHLSHLDTADGALSMVERRLQTLDQVMLSSMPGW